MDFVLLMDHFRGVLNLSNWGYVVASFLMIQLTVLSVTLYLHRDATHRAVDLHPAVRHVFRFWLWLTTGIVTREWVAVHRKHHAKCETVDDPHSPVVHGLKKVLLEGAELYQDEAERPGTCEKYGRGCPDDWLERHVYSGHSYYGIALMVVSFVVLFGVPGIIMIAVQLVSQPLMAAGIINGVGHYAGYRNFESEDASRNVVPWGIFLGGEELHNNHHAYPSSARFSMRWWEFDIGWFVIQILSFFGLAQVRRLPPKTVDDREQIDLETVRAVVVNRMDVLRAYSRNVTLPVWKRERARLGDLPRRAGRLLIRQPRLLDREARQRLAIMLAESQALATVVEYRQRLQALWDETTASNDRLIAGLKEWCAQAEASGIKALEDFAQGLRHYGIRPAINPSAR
jgi:stearoyl-CoA desaturase (delta-9 desaturase)